MTRLLVVDDSALMRRLLVGIFSAQPDFSVEIARNGEEAIAKLHAFSPDVITLDIHMPGMDGLACLDRIMIEKPTPVVMVSALTEQGAEATLEALMLGAVDFIPKPDGAISLEIDTISDDLVSKVRHAAQARLSKAARLTERVRRRTGARTTRLARTAGQPSASWTKPYHDAAGLVLVGTSTGGPAALEKLLIPLPAAFPWPILIAQHMPATFTGALARRLDGICAIGVVEVSAPVRLEAGCAYIGRGDADMIVSRRPTGLFAMAAPLDPGHRWHPSVDRLVNSALSASVPQHLAGVLMTGMGDDGAEAMAKLREGGGLTIAEAEETAAVWGMPGSLVRMGGATLVAPVTGIAQHLIELVGAS